MGGLRVHLPRVPAKPPAAWRPPDISNRTNDHPCRQGSEAV